MEINNEPRPVEFDDVVRLSYDVTGTKKGETKKEALKAESTVKMKKGYFHLFIKRTDPEYGDTIFGLIETAEGKLIELGTQQFRFTDRDTPKSGVRDNFNL
jgi:hypothetical protein